MSETLEEKIQILKNLDEKHTAVLNALMRDKNVKIPELANELGYSVSTVRNFLTDIYKACGVPDTEENKRGYLIRGYAEAYLKKDDPVQRPVEPPQKIEKDPEPIPEPIKAVIDIDPQPPRINLRSGGLVIGLIGVSIIVVIILISALKGMNSPVNNQPAFPGYYSTFEDIPLAPGVVLSGGNYGGGVCDTTDYYWTQSLAVKNSSGYDYDLSITGTKFSLVDNFGRSYRLLSSEMGGLDVEDKEYIRIHSGHSAGIMLCWLDRPDYSDAEYLDLKIMGLLNGGSDIIIRNYFP